MEQSQERKFNKSNTRPTKDGVYERKYSNNNKGNLFAKFADGQWYSPCATIEAARREHLLSPTVWPWREIEENATDTASV